MSKQDFMFIFLGIGIGFTGGLALDHAFLTEVKLDSRAAVAKCEHAASYCEGVEKSFSARESEHISFGDKCIASLEKCVDTLKILNPEVGAQ